MERERGMKGEKENELGNQNVFFSRTSFLIRIQTPIDNIRDHYSGVIIAYQTSLNTHKKAIAIDQQSLIEIYSSLNHKNVIRHHSYLKK